MIDQGTKTILLRMAAAILAAALLGILLLQLVEKFAPSPDGLSLPATETVVPAAPPPEQETKPDAAPQPDDHLTIDGMVPDQKMLEKITHDIQLDVRDLKE